MVIQAHTIGIQAPAYSHVPALTVIVDRLGIATVSHRRYDGGDAGAYLWINHFFIYFVSTVVPVSAGAAGTVEGVVTGATGTLAGMNSRPFRSGSGAGRCS